MEIIYRALDEIKPNPNNPRKAKPKGVEELAESIKANPDYFEARPILLSDRTGELVIVGGERRSEAARYLGLDKVPTILIPGLTEERENELMVVDNLHTGVWDETKLKKVIEGWDKTKMGRWNLETPKSWIDSATKDLSGLEYKPMYYEPKEVPNASLEKCLNFDKFEAKCKVIEESKLTKAQKSLLKWFAYRFIKIDFEQVANYYAFVASEEEKKVIERLRLVLVDDGSVGGFIEDEIIKLNKAAYGEE